MAERVSVRQGPGQSQAGVPCSRGKPEVPESALPGADGGLLSLSPLDVAQQEGLGEQNSLRRGHKVKS